MKRFGLAVLFAVFLSPSLAFGQSVSVVFYNVGVFDGYRMLRGQTVRVKDGVIQEVKPAGKVPETPGFIDGARKTLLPGLIDAHCHIEGDPSKDIRATRNIVGVWVAGRRIDRDAVARMAEASRKQFASN